MRDLLTNQAAAERFHGERHKLREMFEREDARAKAERLARKKRRQEIERMQLTREAPERITRHGVEYIRADLSK